MNGNRVHWEASVAGKYGLDPVHDAGFFDDVWAEGWEEEDYEAFDAHVQSAARYYHRGQENAPGSDIRVMASPGDRTGVHDIPTETTGSRKRPTPSPERILLDDTNSARQQALTEYLHKTAALDRDVMSFRSEVLGGSHKTLSRGEALHRLEEAENPQAGVSVVLVALPEGDFGRRFRVAEDSAWGRLSKLAETLSRRYPWDEGQATAFALCGDDYSGEEHTTVWFTPDVLRAGTREGRYKGHAAHPYNRTVIKMEVASWVPAELVKEVYSKKQKELNGAKRPSRPSLRCIEVFRFVLGHSVAKTVSRSENLARLVLRFDWRDLHGRWDKTYLPGHTWHYGEKGGRNFRRDFGIGQDNVLGAVAGGLLGIPGEPLTSAQRLKLLRERERNKKQYSLPESLKKRYDPNVKVRRL